MGKKISLNRAWLLLSVFFLLLFINASQTEDLDLTKAYWEAKFSLIVDYFQKKDFKELPLKEKLLYIECLARTAQSQVAEEKLNQVLADQPLSGDILATAGIVYFSMGRLKETEEFIDKALLFDPDHQKASLAKIMLLLYLQQHREAEALFEKFVKKYRLLADTFLVYLVEAELYTASRNLRKISRLYERRANKFRKSEKRAYKNLKKSSQLFRKASRGETFYVTTGKDKVAVPFAEPLKQEQFAVLYLTIKGKNFKVLLDTGNEVGWIIHSSELNKSLNSKKGGIGLIQIGTEEGILHGTHIYSKRVDFGDFSINHLTGTYIPKPHQRYHEANFNPAFIRNRVVTLDYIGEQLILRTKERFDQDLNSVAASQPDHFTKLPWYGYKHAFVPVKVGGKTNALAMIETGAADIALKLDFARKFQLNLEPAVRYVSTGKAFRYHKTSIKISAGLFQFERRVAEVWPLDRFFNRITGLTPDVIIGPSALRGRFALSLDPFDKKIILADISY